MPYTSLASLGVAVNSLILVIKANKDLPRRGASSGLSARPATSTKKPIVPSLSGTPRGDRRKTDLYTSQTSSISRADSASSARCTSFWHPRPALPILHERPLGIIECVVQCPLYDSIVTSDRDPSGASQLKALDLVKGKCWSLKVFWSGILRGRYIDVECHRSHQLQSSLNLMSINLYLASRCLFLDGTCKILSAT